MSELQAYRLFIGGEQVEPAEDTWFESFNPYTGRPWARIPKATTADINRAVEAAYAAFTGDSWSRLTASARGALLHKLGDLVAANAERLAHTEVRDNGKLIAEMSAQLRYMPQWYYYFGGLADKIEGAVIPVDKPEMFNFTRHEPYGVVAIVTPWNSPLLLLTWKLAAALAAGNTVVVKPSEYTSASTLEFAALFEQAGFPPGVLNVVTGDGAETGAALVAHDKVGKIAFTGGSAGGRAVYEAAARKLKPVTLELGGKSPNIVFDDADIEGAIKGVVSGIFAATGQTCIAGSRLLVQQSIHDEFVEKLVGFAATARMGNPADPGTQVGPITTHTQYRKVLDYINIAKNEGAMCALGGKAASAPECGEGWFVEPTIFTGVRNEMRIAQEEVFGPVLAVIPFKEEEDAVRIANDIPCGLAAGVWTKSIRRALMMSERIKAGMVWINTYRAVSYMSPFGGFKQSGIGRENGQESIYEFLQTKSVWISTATDVPNPFILR